MNAANTKRVKALFDQQKEISFYLVWKRSSTWGRTCGLYFNRQKLDLASGYGYAKDTAMLESMIYACTGKPISMGANNFLHLHGDTDEFFQGFELICQYDGEWEVGYTFKVKS